eukprot:4304254-Prymnesium_polylepis.1
MWVVRRNHTHSNTSPHATRRATATTRGQGTKIAPKSQSAKSSREASIFQKVQKGQNLLAEAYRAPGHAAGSKVVKFDCPQNHRGRHASYTPCPALARDG